jgi:dTDP-4-amino-4,6-dideoxygalactose transaminase
LHMQKAYDYMNYRQGDFPVTEKVASEIVSLPMYPTLQPEQQARVVREMLRCLRVEMVR